MADNLQRVGLVFTADGTVDFDKSLKQVNASIQENRTAFNLAKSTWDDSTKSIDKMRETQKYLTNQTQDYANKVKILEEELKALESAEERNEKAIISKKSQLNQAKTTLNNYKRGLKEVEEQLESGTADLKDYARKLDDLGEKAKGAGDKLSGVSAGAAGIATAVAATVPATEEYRKIMGSLEVSSELAGYSAEKTEEVYKKLFSVLGDDQTAATTTANLQALGLTQEQLMELVNGTIGGWAKYGDSIPIDGLAEAINETVKAGQVTGTFADILNWAGTSEDGFNEKLENCKTEAERVNLVMQELANQGLAQAGEKWQENNKALTESNVAQAEFQEEIAELAETVAPAITEITKLVTGLLEEFNNLPSGTQVAIGGIILLVATLGPLLSGIGMVTQGVGGTITAVTKISGLITTGAPKILSILNGLGGGAKALFAIINAHPFGFAITAVTGLVVGLVTLYNKCEWFRNGVDRIFGGIKNFIRETVNDIKGFFDFEWDLPKIKVPHFTATGAFSLNPLRVPKFDIQWYAKGGILNSPTIFGANGSQLMGGGEAGQEAVLPIELLRKYIREENNISKNELIAALVDVFGELVLAPEIAVYLGNEKLTDTMSDAVRVKIGDSQMARWRGKGYV